jgi:hypothetical protein
MRVGDIEVPASAAARLALRLDRAGEIGLAHRVGIALDTGHDVALSNDDRKTVVRVLADWPGELAELRDALLSNLRGGNQARATT